MLESRIAIIPARGGSKRIPRKNIKAFYGKPIIAYSIEAALQSNLFDEVMVSTDDEEIAEIAKEYGAKVPFKRSFRNSNDFASLASVTEEVLECYLSKFNYNPVLFATILSTAPFLNKENLKTAVSMFLDKNVDSVMSVGKYSTPIFRSLRIDSRGNLIQNFPEYSTARSQDIPTAFFDAGQFYFSRTEIFKIHKKLSCGNCKPFILSNKYIQDIDNFDDWEEAEMKYKIYFNA